jgi:hypothetical protein
MEKERNDEVLPYMLPTPLIELPTFQSKLTYREYPEGSICNKLNYKPSDWSLMIRLEEEEADEPKEDSEDGNHQTFKEGLGDILDNELNIPRTQGLNVYRL